MSNKSNTVPNTRGPSRFSIEVSAQARFAGEYVRLVRAMSFARVIERSILMYADNAKEADQGWRVHWDRSEGSPEVAWVLMFADRGIPLDQEMERLRDLLYAHEPFFFRRSGSTLLPHRRNIEALWPHIENGVLVAHWAKTKGVDAWATGERMGELLKKARLPVPEWPPGDAR